MNNNTTPEELDAALCVGLNNPDPGVKSQEFDEACKVIAKIKGAGTDLAIATDAAGILANEVRRLQADNDRLENSIAEWQNEFFRLNLELAGIGVCPACETEFVQQIEETVVSCGCGYGTWQGALPFIHRLRQEVETVISRL